jgi:hypothetical protein
MATDTIEKRIEAVRGTEDADLLKRHLCPFFEKGGYPDCMTCRKTEDNLLDCREYYLKRIKTLSMDIWCEDFDKFIVNTRDKVSVNEIIGVGMNCNSCYIYDKCPMYRKDFACGIDWGDKKPATPADMMDFLIDIQYERVRRGSVIEKVDGGVADAGLSGEIDRLNDLMAAKAELGRERISVNIEAKGAAGGAATSAGGGILSKIFGGAPKEIEQPSTISIPAKPSSREDIVDVEEIVEEKETEKVSRKRKRQ